MAWYPGTVSMNLVLMDLQQMDSITFSDGRNLRIEIYEIEFITDTHAGKYLKL